MRAQISLVAAVLFLLTTAEVKAQDLLGLFFDREAASSISGGNPFAAVDPNNMASSIRSGGTADPAVQIDSWIDDVYRETRSDGSDQDLQRNVSRARIHFPLSTDANATALHLDVQSTKMTGSFDVDPKDQGSYDGRDEYVTAGATLPVGDGVGCDFALQKNVVESSIAPGYELGFFYQASEGSVAVRMRDVPRTQFLTLNISGIGGILPLDYLQKGGEVEFNAPIGSLSILVKGHYDYLSPLPQFTRSNDSHFGPDANTRGLTASLLLKLSGRISALCSFGMETVGGNGDFYSQTASYGAFNSFLFENDFFQAGARYAAGSVELISDIKWSLMSGAAAGFAESWPFVTLAQSSLSQARFDGSGNIRMLQAHAGATFPLVEQLGMGIGINVVQLLPQLRLDTWQTKFLSIGERDLQTTACPYREVDAMIFSGGLKGKIGVLGLMYSFSQIIPLKMVALGNSIPAVVSPPATSSRAVRGSGGQFHQVTMFLYL